MASKEFYSTAGTQDNDFNLFPPQKVKNRNTTSETPKPIQIAMAGEYILVILFDDGSIKKIHTGGSASSTGLETIWSMND